MTTRWKFGAIRGAAAASSLPSPVLKVGGSLLVKPGWPDILKDLLAAIEQPLLVVGGGAVVDGLRVIDAASPRPSWLMDDLAIDAMSLTARIVADALDVTVVDSPHARVPAVLDVAAWLRTTPARPDLPASWDVTSDSIAAAVATASGRDLIIAKCVPPPGDGVTLQALADAGWVDPWFPQAAPRIGCIAWAAPA